MKCQALFSDTADCHQEHQLSKLPINNLMADGIIIQTLYHEPAEIQEFSLSCLKA